MNLKEGIVGTNIFANNVGTIKRNKTKKVLVGKKKYFGENFSLINYNCNKKTQSKNTLLFQARHSNFSPHTA